MAEQEISPSAQIPGVNFVVPLDSFQREAVKAAVAASAVADSHDAYARIRTAIAEVKITRDIESAKALEILSQISGYHFKPDDRIEPFGPLAVMDGRRSAIPTDLLAEQVVILSQFVPDVGHPAFRARLADVCWLLNKRDAASGLQAVASYGECVRAVLHAEAQFDFDQTNPASVPAAEYLSRALSIARAMGWNRAEFDPLRQIIADVSQHALDNDDGCRANSNGRRSNQFVSARRFQWARLGPAATGAEDRFLVGGDILSQTPPYDVETGDVSFWRTARAGRMIDKRRKGNNRDNNVRRR